MLYSELFTIVPDHEALQYAFIKRRIHGRLAKWLVFLSENENKISYRPSISHCDADFISKYGFVEEGPVERGNESELALLVPSVQSNLEPSLPVIRSYLSFSN